MKRVRQMAHFTYDTVLQQHLHDVKAHLHFGVLEQFQVIQTTLRKKPALARIHRGSRTDPIFGGTRLYLHKDQAILIAEDEIYFAPVRAKIGRKKF